MCLAVVCVEAGFSQIQSQIVALCCITINIPSLVAVLKVIIQLCDWTLQITDVAYLEVLKLLHNDHA